MMDYIKVVITLFIAFICISVSAQIPGLPVIPSPPTPSSMPPYGGNRFGPKDPTPQQHQSHFRNNSHASDMEMYEQDRMEVERRNAMAMQEIDEGVLIQRQNQLTNYLINNGFPSQMGYPGTEIFQTAYEELSGMLDGSLPINIGRALFLTENAYLGNSLDYADFENDINERVQLCQWQMKEKKLNPKDKLAMNMVIFSLLCDTLQIKEPGNENTVTHYPLEYNYDDYQSQMDFTSHFVSTLMKTNKGQCHSMPLLYLTIADKMGTEAYLSYAPVHSFIKIEGDDGKWHNLELTCKTILSDYHYMNHSYVKSEAIRNKLYMSPLSKKEVIAAMMAQLGAYYYARYGYDPFLIECADKAIEFYPNNTQALVLKAAYQERLTIAIANLLQARNPEMLREISPAAYKHHEKMLEEYRLLDNTGYEDTPVQVYETWVKHINNLKAESENN